MLPRPGPCLAAGERKGRSLVTYPPGLSSPHLSSPCTRCTYAPPASRRVQQHAGSSIPPPSARIPCGTVASHRAARVSAPAPRPSRCSPRRGRDAPRPCTPSCPCTRHAAALPRNGRAGATVPPRMHATARVARAGAPAARMHRAPPRSPRGGRVRPRHQIIHSRPKPAYFLVGLHRYRLVVMPTTRMMQSASRESSPRTNSSRRGALLLRGILRIARSLFEHLVDERCTRPVLVHE